MMLYNYHIGNQFLLQYDKRAKFREGEHKASTRLQHILLLQVVKDRLLWC